MSSAATRVRFAAEVPHGTMAERLRSTCDMHDVALAQLIARTRRERPGASQDEIDRAVTAWLAGGDAGPGRARKIGP